MIVVGAFILGTLNEHVAGHGLVTYRNYRGALMSNVGAAVTFAVLVLCAVAAYGVRWWHHRQQRKYDEILRARASATNTEEGKSTGTGS